MPHTEPWRIAREGLFTEVRGRGILRSSLAGSCITRPPEPRGWLLRATTPRTRDLHLVVRDRYAGRRIDPAGHPVSYAQRPAKPLYTRNPARGSGDQVA